MDLDVDFYRDQDNHILLTVKGPAQGPVRFPDLNTLITFLMDCQVILESFEDAVAVNRSMIPDYILEAFEEDTDDNGVL